MKSFRMFTAAVGAAAILPRLAQRGMFVDGVTYASIARNLAAGRGSFWSPFYTATIYPQFHEHPPLGFWLQSLWFRVLGDHLFVERAYSLAAAIGTGLLIASTWRRLNGSLAASPDGVFRAGFGRRPGSDFDWLPILFWILVPVVSWAIAGNLLEASLSMMTTAAVAAVVESAFASSPAASVSWGIVSGVCIVAAALVKGPVGLFPLAAPVLFGLISCRRRAIAALGGQWGAVALGAFALLAFETPRASLVQYLNQQVLASLGGQREMSAGSLTIVIQLVAGVLAPMAIAGGVIAAAARRYVRPPSSQLRQAAALFLLGLAGTLPIAASVKQAGHYLVPAVPLYALAAASLFAATSATLSERLGQRRERVVNSLSVVILIGALGAWFVPALGRDRERLADLDALAATVPRGTTIGICPGSNGDWGLHAWFARRFGISLDAADGPRHEWFLATADRTGGCPPVGCTPATDASRQLVLLKCSRDVRQFPGPGASGR